MGLLSYLDKQVHHIRRYNQIIAVLAKYGFEDLVSYMDEKKRFSWIKKLMPRKTLRDALRLTKWEKMRLVCEELGPTFVKFGQLMSNRPDLLPAGLVTELEKLQDAVPPFPGSEAERVIEEQLHNTAKNIFADFETYAFASASMAQVHRATLKTGEKVVVKIQRPGIKETIESDIKAMYYVADLLTGRIPSIKSFDPVGLIRSFEESISRELDFVHESINVQRFSNNFSEDPASDGTIHSPQVYREFTTEKVLTLEFIDGIKISDLEKLAAAGADRKILARRLIASYLKQVFRYGFFHADPHPGNIFVLTDNRICFIDYGMMGNILKKDLEQLGNLFMSVRSKDIRKLIRALQSLSDNVTIKNYRELESDLYEFVNSYAVREVHQNELSTVLLEIKDIVIKHGLKVPTHFFLLARSLVSVEGVARQLDPQLDISKMARPFLINIAAMHYSPIQFTKRVLNSVYEMGMYMEEFPRDLKNAIRKINTGEIKVDLQHKGIDPLVHTLNRVSRHIVSAVIISALIVGSALVIVAKIPPVWNQTSLFGILGLSGAAFIGMGLMNDLRKGDNDGGR